MRDEAQERLELLSAIHDLGYESLRYSIFNDHRPREWETRIEYNPELEVYEVYSTMDRASTNGKDSYQKFQEARIRFIEILENVVFINRYYVDEGIGAEYSSPLWDEKGDEQKLRNEAKERLELISTIQDLGYESLRYSIFNDHRPGEWEVRIEFDSTSEHYFVYSTMDRASYNKKLEFDNFEAAKNKFLEKLDLTIEINKLFVENGEIPEYSSPLWDKTEADIENMKCIVEQEIKKRHFESLHYVLFDETKHLPWAFHLYQKNRKFYVEGRDERSYIVGHSKEYDNFENAKKDFLKKLELVIESNKLNIQLGLSAEYPSPLWDEKEGH